MNYGRITKEAAIKATSKETVTELEESQMELTGRITEGTKDFGTDEFKADIKIDHEDYDMLIIYVFIDRNQLKEVDDFGSLDWENAILNTAEYELV